VRTICPREGGREHLKKHKRRCGKSSVAAFLLGIYDKNVQK